MSMPDLVLQFRCLQVFLLCLHSHPKTKGLYHRNSMFFSFLYSSILPVYPVTIFFASSGSASNFSTLPAFALYDLIKLEPITWSSPISACAQSLSCAGVT